jgi:peroxiredoxin
VTDARPELLALPEGLPVPVDDGACDHLLGLELPHLVLDSSSGSFDLAEFSAGLAVLFVYPRAGLPGQTAPEGWDAIPGARGCTPQACAFRDLQGELSASGAGLAGLSAQTIEDQRAFARLRELSYPVVADPGLVLAAAIGLPTFEAGDLVLYRRVTLVCERGRIEKVFYPVFPPDRNAAEVVAWLTERG